MPATLRRYTLIVLILMSPVLSAAQASQAPLLAQELSTYRLLTLFHLLRVEQGSPDVQARLKAMGVAPGGGTPEEFAQVIKADAAIYADITKAANIRITQ